MHYFLSLTYSSAVNCRVLPVIEQHLAKGTEKHITLSVSWLLQFQIYLLLQKQTKLQFQDNITFIYLRKKEYHTFFLGEYHYIWIIECLTFFIIFEKSRQLYSQDYWVPKQASSLPQQLEAYLYVKILVKLMIQSFLE